MKTGKVLLYLMYINNFSDMINRKRFTEQEYQWVLRVYEWNFEDEEYEHSEKDVFATEEEAQTRLKELYEKALEEHDIYKSSFDVNKAQYFPIYYNEVGDVKMCIHKEKTNYLDMTVGEFYDKMSFIYGDKQVPISSAEGYETVGFIADLTDEDWIFKSPYYTFKFQVYYYSPHPDDVIYKIIGDGFGREHRGMELYRDDKMSKVLQDIKNEDDEYYTALLSNVKKITDMGGEYVIISNRQEEEYRYLLWEHKDEFCISWEDGKKIAITARKAED